MKSYDHKKIEKRWQETWSKAKLYETKDAANNKENFYLLVEFPYPSGNLHVGHWYAFAVPDILARHMRMRGKNVLYPIGFDAFGLPAENAAIKNKLNPREWTLSNIEYMKKQIVSMGTSFDWSREVATCDPAYYKWTQWLFLQLHKNGLVYRKETAVNWCPKDKTVLANEQVVDGHCERCDSEVEQRQMLQWNIKITDYADRLIDDLKDLDWPEQIKQSQRNWIGRSEGAMISFPLQARPTDSDQLFGQAESFQEKTVEVFTTRPDTLFGATYLVLAPEHSTVRELQSSILNWGDVETYINATKKKTELERQVDQKEKTGVKLEGVGAINPANGEKIPLYVADYVLGHYGTGAIMAVPAHDERDFEFAKKFNLPIRYVVAPRFIDERNPHIEGKKLEPRNVIMGIVWNNKLKKYLGLRWKKQPWTTFIMGGMEGNEHPEDAARREIAEETGYKNLTLKRVLGGPMRSEFFAAHKDVNRIAYMTAVFFEMDNEEVPSALSVEEAAIHEVVWLDPSDITEEKLNHSELPEVLARIRTGSDVYTGDGFLINSAGFDGMSNTDAKKAIVEKVGGRFKNTYRLRDWIVSRQRYWGVPIPIIHCEKCGEVPVGDTELPVVLPEVEDYLPTGDGKSPLAKVASFVNVACPLCGGEGKRETDTLDTFVDSSWYFLRYTDPKNQEEFASKEKLGAWMPVDLYSGGAEHTTMHVLYSRFWQKALFDCGLVSDYEPYVRRMNRSLIMGPDGQKMSKSRGNVIDPDDVVSRLGADTVRMYLAFIGPYNEVSNYPWNPDGVVGVRRFLERLARVGDMCAEIHVSEIDNLLHKTIRKVGEDIAALKFNTAISALMIMVNTIEKRRSIGREQFEALLKISAPFAPHLVEELWYGLGHTSSVHLEAWPDYDPFLLRDDVVTMVVQINGKTRAEIEIAADSDKKDVEKNARDKIASRLKGTDVVRVVVVPNRLINFVVKE